MVKQPPTKKISMYEYSTFQNLPQKVALGINVPTLGKRQMEYELTPVKKCLRELAAPQTLMKNIQNTFIYWLIILRAFLLVV